MVSADTINQAWAITYILALATVAIAYFLLPRAEAPWGGTGAPSTSKTQVLIWTFAVLFALWSLPPQWARLPFRPTKPALVRVRPRHILR
jgi:hypothetical protein